jgi:hypothetical protein
MFLSNYGGFAGSGTGGSDPSLEARVTALENALLRVEYYQIVSSPSGSITPPSGATILLDQFAGSADALVSKVDANNHPTFVSPQTSGGTYVAVNSFDVSGNYVLTGTPSDSSYAIIYVYSIARKNLDITKSIGVEETNIYSNADKAKVDALPIPSSLTSGSILFWNGTSISENNSNFFWDNSNVISYVGTNTGAFANTKLHTQGSFNGYIQNNIWNKSNGISASSDWIATADTGNDTTNFVDIGINSSTYSDASFTVVGALGSYLYNNGGDLAIGTGSASKNLIFFTGGTLAANQAGSIDSSQRWIIGTGIGLGQLTQYYNPSSIPSTIVLTGGATITNSTTITYNTNTSVKKGDYISGTGIPANAIVTYIISSTSSIISRTATATNTGLTFTVRPSNYMGYHKYLFTEATNSVNTGIYIDVDNNGGSNGAYTRGMIINMVGSAGSSGSKSPLELISDASYNLILTNSGASYANNSYAWSVTASGLQLFTTNAATNGFVFNTSAGTSISLLGSTSNIIAANNGTVGLQLRGVAGGAVNTNYTAVDVTHNGGSGGGISATTGTINILGIGLVGSNATFIPTSGSAVLNMMNFGYTITQTVSASGTVRGIYYSPVINSILGSHYILESTSGDMYVGGAGVYKLYNGTGAATALSSASSTSLIVGSGFGTTNIYSNNLTTASVIAQFTTTATGTQGTAYFSFTGLRDDLSFQESIFALVSPGVKNPVMKIVSAGGIATANTFYPRGGISFSGSGSNNKISAGSNSTPITLEGYNNGSGAGLIITNAGGFAPASSLNVVTINSSYSIGTAGVNSSVLAFTGQIYYNASGTGTVSVFDVNPTIPTAVSTVANNVTNVYGFRSRINTTTAVTGSVYNIFIDGNAPVYFGGGTRFKYNALSANTTLDVTYRIIDADASGGVITITLPSASSVGNGFFFSIMKTDASANTITINTTGGQTINGSASQSLSSQYSAKAFYSDGANWKMM